MRITFFGIGYVGLVQAAVFAEAGYNVLCVDVDQQKVDRLKDGIIPIYEQGLETIVRENSAAGRLSFSTSPRDGVEFSDVHFIAVGTPAKQDGSSDLTYIDEVAQQIGKYLDRNATIVVKSTVPVGTGDRVCCIISDELAFRSRTDIQFQVASNPEFSKEGSAIADCRKPDRIIIGTNNSQTEQLLRELYAPFNRNHEKIIAMDVRSSELTKYASNCMLATKISFMNEMANIADRVGADIEKIRIGIGADPRIGYHFIYPGIGYGGSCFPKDVQATIRIAQDHGFDPALLKAVEERNEAQKLFLVEKIIKHFRGALAGRTFAVWGLAFKPGTDDMREAPSRMIIDALIASGAFVRAFDPVAMSEAQKLYRNSESVTFCRTREDALQGADALILATEWKQFQAPDFSLICKALIQPVIFDGRNLYDPSIAARHGVKVYSVGRLPSP